MHIRFATCVISSKPAFREAVSVRREVLRHGQDLSSWLRELPDPKDRRHRRDMYCQHDDCIYWHIQYLKPAISRDDCTHGSAANDRCCREHSTRDTIVNHDLHDKLARNDLHKLPTSDSDRFCGGCSNSIDCHFRSFPRAE
jgi:hypothetical protein